VVLTEEIKAHILCNRVYDVARAEREAEKEAAKQEKLEREAKKAQLAEEAKAAKAAKEELRLRKEKEAKEAREAKEALRICKEKEAQDARAANRIRKDILDAKEVRVAPEILAEDDAGKALATNTTRAYKKIPNQVRIATWATHIGNRLDAICMCCEIAVITIADFHCAHVTAECLGGKATIDNLRPICAACNSGMRTRNLFEYKNSHFPSKKPREQADDL
jgi:hypothetical protein